jgi:hypothetical protein
VARHVFVMIMSITDGGRPFHIFYSLSAAIPTIFFNKMDAQKVKKNDDYNLEVISGPIGR